jgi:hypothetical protein
VPTKAAGCGPHSSSAIALFDHTDPTGDCVNCQAITSDRAWRWADWHDRATPVDHASLIFVPPKWMPMRLGLPPALHLYRARQEGGYGLLSSIRYNLPA